MDRRMYPSNEPLPPSDRRAYLEGRIRGARERIASLRSLWSLAEVATLKMKIADWQRELRELEK